MRLYTFSGSSDGRWRVLGMKAVTGEGLPTVTHLAVGAPAQNAIWTLRGIVSNARYTTAAEKEKLSAVPNEADRPEASRAALIPVRKSAAWWDLPQDERRKIFEETSRHTKTGLRYVPAIMRRLHHCRDLSETEPFDFLTWFEYAPEYSQTFEDLVGELRATEEWGFIEREVDIRLSRSGIG